MACSNSGCTWSVILSPIQSANDSLSQRSSHHSIVTRSPNHMCASSCAVMRMRFCRCAGVAVAESSSRIVSRYVIAPGFSIAPAQYSGTAMRSTFSNGCLLPKYFSSAARIGGVISAAYFVSRPCPFGAMTRPGTLIPAMGVDSNSPTAMAMRYDGSGFVLREADRLLRRPSSTPPRSACWRSRRTAPAWSASAGTGS